MKVVAFVPIKLDNKRFPNKNLKKFYDGTPLFHFILKTLLQIQVVDQVYVFCSDKSIKENLPLGIHFLQREKELDTDNATPQDIINSFISKVDADIYISAHATSPFVKKESIEKCIDAIINNIAVSAFTARAIKKLLWQDNKALNFDPADIPRTQDLPNIYAEVSAAYVFTKEMFLKKNRRTGDNPFICDVTEIEAIDIDYEIDFKIADAIYEKIINAKASND